MNVLIHRWQFTAFYGQLELFYTNGDIFLTKARYSDLQDVIVLIFKDVVWRIASLFSGI
jgi:hypothetical protein